MQETVPSDEPTPKPSLSANLPEVREIVLVYNDTGGWVVSPPDPTSRKMSENKASAGENFQEIWQTI